MLFDNIDLTVLPEYIAATGRKGYSDHAKIRAFVVMKCECFSCVTDLLDYLQNNLLIAHYSLPSYWTLERFIKKHKNELLKLVMQTQVKKLFDLGVLDTSFIALDSTPISANTSQNNPKSFKKDKFKPENQPASDKDCKLGVHTASNQHDEKNYEFYWGYKNHILVDCITGLPIYEMTTTADVYNTVKDFYEGECCIPINKRNTKNPEKLPSGHLLCEAGLAMSKDGKTSDRGRTRQKFCCPFKNSKTACCPCNHKNWNNGKKNRGCTKYVTIPDDYRLAIDRESLSFKKIYALRTEAERYNARFKQTGQERAWVHSFNAVQNLNTIAHIALLAVAIAATVTQSDYSVRCLKSVKRIA